MLEEKRVHALYAIEKSYADNLKSGPQFFGPLPKNIRLPEEQWIDFLGYSAASPLGVPAGPLLSSQWTTLAAKLGFDIVTYKTIRSQAHPGHPLPNIVFVAECTKNRDAAIQVSQPEETTDISITNSFGMPSLPADFLQKDIAKARAELIHGQILIVSVVSTPGMSENGTDDFVRTALMAKEAGAQIIEANFSCPNISSKEGALYTDPESAYEIAKAIARAIHPLPLMVKVGSYPTPGLNREVLIALARAGCRGVCGINTVPRRILDADHQPALGKDREIGGVCGKMVRPVGLQFVKETAAAIAAEKLDLELVGCGGIMLPEHFDAFLAAGAKVAMSATGMMWDPYLGLKWKHNRSAK